MQQFLTKTNIVHDTIIAYNCNTLRQHFLKLDETDESTKTVLLAIKYHKTH